MGVTTEQQTLPGADGRLGERDGLRWWPSLLGVVIAVLSGLGADDAGGYGPATIVAVAAFIYVAAAAQASPRAAWGWFVATFPVIVLGKVFDLGWLPIVAFVGLALAFVVHGAVRDRWRTPGGLRRQAVAMVPFGAVALLGYLLGWTAGGLLVAAGLAAHGIWDVVHHRSNRVVPRSYAEFCGVLDLVLAGIVAWAVLV